MTDLTNPDTPLVPVDCILDYSITVVSYIDDEGHEVVDYELSDDDIDLTRVLGLLERAKFLAVASAEDDD